MLSEEQVSDHSRVVQTLWMSGSEDESPSKPHWKPKQGIYKKREKEKKKKEIGFK